MASQEVKDFDNIKEEYFEDIFVSKLSITLPQDIILILFSNKIDWEKNDNYIIFYNKILDNYNKNIHIQNNIKRFLSNYIEENNKIVIYTFTRGIDNIKQNYLNSINIKSLGMINQINIKFIEISLIKNEFDLEVEIEEFLDNNNLKICFIKLLPYEYSNIDYIKTIIENKEKEYKNKQQNNIINKLFIFLVHLERVFNKDLANPSEENKKKIKNKMLTRTLSNLAEYKQILIDDLNSDDYFYNGAIITLDKIMKMKNHDLFKVFLNKEKTIIENINSSFCYFDYSFNLDKNILNKNIYMNDLIELFNEDKQLINFIDKLIIENIIYKYSKNEHEYNIMEKIIKEEKFTRGDICIFDIVKKVLNKNYIDEFKIYYIELEKTYFFSSIINNRRKYIDNKNNYENNEFNQKLLEIFINNINIKNKVPENEVKIEIIIGYNFPSKYLLEKINDYILIEIEKYRQAEEKFKINLYESEEEFEEGKQHFNNNIKYIISYLQSNLSKNVILKEIESKFNESEKNKFYNLFLKDYLLYFIFKN